MSNNIYSLDYERLFMEFKFYQDLESINRHKDKIRNSFYPITDIRYISPTTDDISYVIGQILKKVTMDDLILSLDIKKDEIELWLLGENKIPYSCWRLLLVYAGIIMIFSI